MLTARAGEGAGVIAGLLYIVGGSDSEGNPLTANEAYNPITDSWTAATEMTVAEDGAGVAVVNNVLFVVGGGNPGNLANTQLFNPLFGASPSLATVPAAVAFGRVTHDTTSSPKNVTLSNKGASPITIAGSGVSGANASDFAEDTSACPIVLAVGANCTVSLTFSPTQVKNTVEKAAITILDNAGNNPQYIHLSGTSF
jgi:Kelch motif/Abnormal spindle-like microcephaly-assoc'd, ASPM-SPD-2-Hydin